MKDLFPAPAAMVKGRTGSARRYELTLEQVARGTQVSVEVYRKG